MLSRSERLGQLFRGLGLASVSRLCRWPYAKVKAWQRKPSLRAMAKVVAESRPPLSKMTAFLSATG